MDENNCSSCEKSALLGRSASVKEGARALQLQLYLQPLKFMFVCILRIHRLLGIANVTTGAMVEQDASSVMSRAKRLLPPRQPGPSLGLPIMWRVLLFPDEISQYPHCYKYLQGIVPANYYGLYRLDSLQWCCFTIKNQFNDVYNKKSIQWCCFTIKNPFN